MAFIDYQQLENTYPTGRMKENIRRLKEFDLFHCLLSGNIERAEAVKKRIPTIPIEYTEWLKNCDGGMLFDTTLLSTKSHDSVLNLTFVTYGDYYNHTFREDNQISEDCFVFAVAIHSDLFFFDTKKNDGKVYQWDVEEHRVYAVWDSFIDWITDQINDAIELISKEELEPLDIKLEASEND